MTLRVFISPSFPNIDAGEGGIRRVVEAQRKHLPAFGIEVVDREQDADLVAIHAGSYVETRKPVVAHNHGLYWTPEYPWSEWAHSLNNQVVNVLRRCDAATAPSNWVSYIIKRGMNIDAQTVYHGIDADEWVSDPKSHPYVLWNKTRVDAICDLGPIDELAKRMPNVDFVTTFAPPQSGTNVRVTGRLPHHQAKNLIQAAAVYLCTARETFGVGTLEAMAAGAVVVGFDWGGQSEIITSGVNGLLVPPYDYDALVAAVQRVLGDTDEAQQLRIAARSAVEQRFTWENACEQYAGVYRTAYERIPKKRVSVIITCYNLAHALPRAVASVDMPDAEIVVVNDASPDDTQDVADRLAVDDARIRVVTNESNLYLAESLNKGIELAQGAYIVPLDADNELAPGALRTLADTLDSTQDVDVAYGSMQVVEEPDGKVFVSSWPTRFIYEQQMAHRNQIPSTSMYRRKWHERAGGYRRRCRTAEDADFWCRVTSLGAQPRKVTERPTLIYHDRKESMSHVESDWAWEAWYTWGRLPSLVPFGAPAMGRKHVPTYQPAAVTVVIPVGPGHDVLVADALDSLVAQTYLGWRCVVVDDRPWGSSPLVEPPWVQRWSTEKDKHGPAHARNVGLAAVHTPYVLFLDADDYLAPNALEILVQTAMDRGGPGVGEWYYSDWYKQEEGKVYRAPDFVAEHLRTHLTHSVTAMYPTALLKDVGGFDESLDAWEDWDMVLKLIEAGACGVHLPFPLFYYRYAAGSRREQLYADRHRHTEVMKTKWRKYMVENQPMPCGCQGGRTIYVPPVQVGDTPIPVSKDGATLVEFVGRGAPRTWRGPSGAEYRFGADIGHRLKHVRNEDLPMFMHRPDFQLALADAQGFAILAALGPPNRMAEFMEPPVAAGV